MEGAFTATFSEQVRSGRDLCPISAQGGSVKAGVEFADGCPSVGAVVTGGRSDWSLAPTPNWGGHRVHLKVSRRGDAFTIRASRKGRVQLVHVVPFEQDLVATPDRSPASRPEQGYFIRARTTEPTRACTSDPFAGSARRTAPSETPGGRLAR
jgi:regulation of enolase protein 1 (concanavalin A-like superfamily)